MDENLVGYLLHILDPRTRQQVEAYLRSNPAARQRLALLEQALAPLAQDDMAPNPPPDLVEATLARVAALRPAQLPAAPAPSPYQVSASAWRWARRADLAAAAVLLFVVGGLVSPLVVRAWGTYHRNACAGNLRHAWVALEAYGDRNQGAFPCVEPQGPRAFAGVFAPLLHDAGLLAEIRPCPARECATAPPISMDELEEVHRTDPERFRTLAGMVAGNYAYCLGYREGMTHRGLRRDSGDRLPIMADCPGADGTNSLNHGGSGQNVLYVGGAVRWCVHTSVGEGRDDIYLNRDFRVGAGLNRSDTVLGASGDRP
jgi:hypothetical protein